MVKTLLKSAFREIRQSLGRYLAILAIIGLGVGFFAGLRMCQPSMMATGVGYLRQQQMHDFRILSTLGFTQEDVDAFAALDGISAARGGVYVDALMDLSRDDGETAERVIRLHTLTEDIDLPKLTAGRMPRADDECLGDARYFTEADLGRQVRVSSNNKEDTRDLLAYEAYTLVGLVQSPSYLNYDRGTSSIGTGSVAAFLYLPEGGFNYEVYYEIYLRIDRPANAYSDEYEVQILGLQDAVEALADERAELRYADIYGDAMEEIRDAEQEIADGWAEYRQERADAEQELADAHQELLDGEKEYTDGLADYEQGKLDYADGLAEYRKGQRELGDAKQKLADADIQLQDAKAQLDDAKKSLDEGNASYDQLNTMYQSADQLAQATKAGTPSQLIAALRSGRSPRLNASVDQALQAQGSSLAEFMGGWDAAEASIGQELTPEYLAGLRMTLDQGQTDYDAGLTEYEQGKADYEAGLAKYEDGVRELQDAKRKLSSAKRDLDDAPAELADARAELDDGWAEYEDGKKEADEEFADAERELLDAEDEVADAYQELEDLREAETFVLTREENIGYASFENDTSIVAAISLVFPVFFFLVAALVCMTTMTRMVDEERTQIGVLKAMGYSNAQIMSKYLFYSGSAALIGSWVGYLIGSHWLPWIIWEIYGMLYNFAPLQFTFDPALAGISFAAALLCSMGATYFACRAELRRHAAELIRPKSPRAGRRVFLEYITPLWRRLSFLHKVSVRNVLRYRSRLVMMVLGIGGCTALLLTGFGIRDSVKSVVNQQFAEITLYDYSVTFLDPQTEDSAADYLEERGWTQSEGLLAHTGSVDVITDDGNKSVYLVAPSRPELDGFLSLHHGETSIDYPGPGQVVLNVGLAENLGISVGDSVQLRDEDLGVLDVTVSAICDNYVYNYAYVSPETYRQQLGEDLEFKTLYVLAHPEADPFEEGTTLTDDDLVSNVSVNEATRQQVDKMLSRMDYVVLVVVTCAAALAFIVLYNLTNINITERIREIATIKVLGFYKNEVASYVFREINILSVLGSLAGLLMGKALHAFVMAQIQIDSMFFPNRIDPWSYVYALALTVLFTQVISLGMRPRLSHIHMAESLKSIE